MRNGRIMEGRIMLLKNHAMILPFIILPSPATSIL